MTIKDMKFPISLSNASPDEVDYYWQAIPEIQLATPRGWWGNALQPKNLQFGSEYAEVGPDGITIDRTFLSRKEALAVRGCEPLVTMGIAKSVSAECVNINADRIECTVDPELTGVVPEAIVGGDYANRFEVSPAPALRWQDTVDTGPEYQDTVDTGGEYRDES